MKVAMEIDPEAEEYYNIEVKADKKKKTAARVVKF